MRARVGYFKVIDMLKAAGMKTEPLADGSVIVFDPKCAYSVIPRPKGRLPDYDPDAVELVIKSLTVFDGKCDRMGELEV